MDVPCTPRGSQPLPELLDGRVLGLEGSMGLFCLGRGAENFGPKVLGLGLDAELLLQLLLGADLLDGLRVDQDPIGLGIGEGFLGLLAVQDTGLALRVGVARVRTPVVALVRRMQPIHRFNQVCGDRARIMYALYQSVTVI